MEKKNNLGNVIMRNAYLHLKEPHNLKIKLSKREVEKILNKINYQENKNALVKIIKFNYDNDGKLYSIWQILIKKKNNGNLNG